jgi:hypothetical protein
MSFGKRLTPPGQRKEAPAPTWAAAPLSTASVEQSATVRVHAMRDTMLELLGVACSIADAVRNDGAVALPGLDSALHSDTTPLNIRGFNEHFTYTEGGRTLHPVYGYLQAGPQASVDISTQVQIHHLVLRIMELNVFCQRAEREGALRVALQSPKLPPLVDRILVGCAFFAGFFENLATSQTMLEPGSVTRLPLDFDFSKLAANSERRRLMAFDRMLAPETQESLLPLKKWPFVGIEKATTPHAGQRFVDGVYFPKDLAPQPLAPLIRNGMTAA